MNNISSIKKGDKVEIHLISMEKQYQNSQEYVELLDTRKEIGVIEVTAISEAKACLQGYDIVAFACSLSLSNYSGSAGTGSSSFYLNKDNGNYETIIYIK